MVLAPCQDPTGGHPAVSEHPFGLPGDGVFCLLCEVLLLLAGSVADVVAELRMRARSAGCRLDGHGLCVVVCGYVGVGSGGCRLLIVLRVGWG